MLMLLLLQWLIHGGCRQDRCGCIGRSSGTILIIIGNDGNRGTVAIAFVFAIVTPAAIIINGDNIAGRCVVVVVVVVVVVIIAAACAERVTSTTGNGYQRLREQWQATVL